MIVRINGRIVDLVNEKKNEIETIGVPNLDNIDLYSPLLSLSVNEIDMVHYHFLSKFEATEFMYRLAKWSVSEVVTGLGIPF